MPGAGRHADADRALGLAARAARIAFVGDGNNVCTSLVHAAMMLGMSVQRRDAEGLRAAGRSRRSGRARSSQKGAGLTEFTDPKEAVDDVDAIYTDVWTSMGQEVEYAERKKTFKRYQVNEAMMALAKPRRALHALPARPSRRGSQR